MSKSEMALFTCNVPWKNTLTMEILLDIMDGKRPIGEWIGQIDMLLNEVHPSVLQGLAMENELPLSKLHELFRKLPCAFQSRHASDFFNFGIIREEKYC